jgi:peptide-methionine (S)-S-oxide reductase
MENQGIQEGLEIATLAGGCFVVRSSFLRIREYMLLFLVILGKQLILPRKYVMEIQDMQKQLKSLSILLKSVRRSFGDLLQHDPTTINRQEWCGNAIPQWDILSQRGQKKTAEDYIGLMTAEDTFGKRIVTKISPVKFYEGTYYDNKSQGYCSYVITLK